MKLLVILLILLVPLTMACLYPERVQLNDLQGRAIPVNHFIEKANNDSFHLTIQFDDPIENLSINMDDCFTLPILPSKTQFIMNCKHTHTTYYHDICIGGARAKYSNNITLYQNNELYGKGDIKLYIGLNPDMTFDRYLALLYYDRTITFAFFWLFLTSLNILTLLVLGLVTLIRKFTSHS